MKKYYDLTYVLHTDADELNEYDQSMSDLMRYIEVRVCHDTLTHTIFPVSIDGYQVQHYVDPEEYMATEYPQYIHKDWTDEEFTAEMKQHRKNKYIEDLDNGKRVDI